MTSRAMRPLSLTVPPETLRLVTTARMSFSDALVLRGILVARARAAVRPCCVEAFEELVEGGVSGSAFEDAVEPRSQFGCAFRAGGELERLELTIEPPDHPPRDFDCAALPVVGGDELVDETLGVNPTQRVVADAELPRVIGEDDGAGEPILGAERAPQRAFAGHAHGIRGDPQLG